MILALDCATKTGWCLMKKGKVWESGVQDFSKTRGESNGAMFLRFRHWLDVMINGNAGRVLESIMELSDGKPETALIHFVIFEQAHHRGGAATEIAVNLTGRVQELCEEHKILFASVHTATLKKYATGKGTADKAMMMEKAKELLGRMPVDDNEGDAVLLADYAWTQYCVE